MTQKTQLLHDQISGVNENQHHKKIHDLSSHVGTLDESKIKYRNPPLHTHKFDSVVSGKIKVKKDGQAETKPHSLIEFRGSNVAVSENTQFDRIIVEIDTSVITVPAGTPEHYVLSAIGSSADSEAIWNEPYIKQSFTGTMIGTRPEINITTGSYVSISAVDDPVNNRVNFSISALGVDACTTVTSETSFGQAANAGSVATYSRGDHTHGTPTNPITAHEITYNHANLPTADQKAALAGTSGTPSSTNKYVTNNDTRNTDPRTPTVHNSTYHSVAYEIQSNKGIANGYCELDSYVGVPTNRLGTYTPTSSNFLRGDRTWSTILWANVDKGSSNISDLSSHSHTALDDIGTNTHATIDSAISSLSTHISATSGVHGCTSSATANKIIIRDSSGRAEVGAPTSTKEIANKGYCDGLSHLPAGSLNNILYYDGSWKTLAAPSAAANYHLGCMKGTMAWDPV